MKKLGKLSINSEKVMKNEELIILKGGYDTNCCLCSQRGIMVGTTKDDCDKDCESAGMGHGTWLC